MKTLTEVPYTTAAYYKESGCLIIRKNLNEFMSSAY